MTAEPSVVAAADDQQDPRAGVAESATAQVAVATGDGMVICDEDLRYVWANPAACRIMGYPLEELLGRNFLINFPERMHGSMVEAYRAQLAGQTGTFTGSLLRPDGSELDMTWTNMTFVHGGRRTARPSSGTPPARPRPATSPDWRRPPRSPRPAGT